MSAAAAWANTATATLWSCTGIDAWSQRASYAAPVTFACDYKSDARTRTDSTGREYVSRHCLYTERADIKRGDYVLIGTSTAADPTLVAGAEEVKDVLRYADTFDRKADDLEVTT